MPYSSRVLLKTLSAITVVTAGTQVPLSATSLLVYSVSVQSLRTNTGFQYIGDSTVETNNGYEFGPSDVAEVDPPHGAHEPQQIDLKDIYVNSTTNNAEFRVVVWIRA